MLPSTIQHHCSKNRSTSRTMNVHNNNSYSYDYNKYCTMFLLVTVLILIQIGLPCHAQEDDPWVGCINPAMNRNQNLIRIQQPTRICLSIANDTNWNTGSTSYLRASFEPKADVYSRFHIPNCTYLCVCVCVCVCVSFRLRSF
jgi:hypothetical protein